MVNAETFRTALKAVGKNSENMSSKIYNFSTMQNIRMQYELYEGLHGPRKTDCIMSQLVRKVQRQTDAMAGRFLSSRSAWKRGISFLVYLSFVYRRMINFFFFF